MNLMADRVGSVWEWVSNGDLIVVVRKCFFNRSLMFEWECRSLTTTRVSWLTDGWFSGDPKRSELIRRVA